MDICEYCNNEILIKYGSGRFCNKKCACGFSTKSKRVETHRKISKALKGRKSLNTANYWAKIPKEERKCRFTKEQILKGNETTRRLTQERINNTEFHLLSKYTKKKIISEEQEYKCLHCGLSSWLEQPIVLELDHIDGNKKNEYRNNLRCLCPNCHSQTDTWKGKNIKKCPNTQIGKAASFKNL